MLKNISIAKKLPALFALLTTISVASVGMLSYMEMAKSMEKDVLTKVQATEGSLNNSFANEFGRINADLEVMAQSNVTQDALVRLGAGFENIDNGGDNLREFLQRSYISQSPFPEGGRHNLESVDDGSYYSKFHPKYHGWFRNIMLEYGYHDIFLVSASGDVVYSVYKESDFADNVNSAKLRNTGLAQAVLKAQETGEKSMTDFEPYAPSSNILAAFSGVPIQDQYENIIGTLVVQITPEPFLNILNTDDGYTFDKQVFVLGNDQQTRFSVGVDPKSDETAADFFVGTEIGRAAASGERGVTMFEHPTTGEEWITSFGTVTQHGADLAIVWQARSSEVMSALSKLRNQVLLVGVITLIVVTVIGFFIARSISTPLQELQVGLLRFVQTGDLTIRVGTDAKDEVGQSTRAVDEIMEMTQRAMSQIKSSNDTSVEAAEKMRSAAQVMSANAETQSSSVEELSSSVEETESQVRSNAESAREANDLVVGTSRIVEDGKEKINRMVESMDNIKSSSADIAKIIKVIDEIAFQTNLLALNAAVEAARAGQHGRGFAVVAAEVRNLAGRSAKAAQETSELIVGSSKRVEAGVEVSSQAREAFDKIAGDISQVTELVGKISMASDEQARGVTYINRAIQEISDSAMTNAVRAEELTVVASELSESNEAVRKQIGQFDLGPQGVTSAALKSSTAQAPAKAPAKATKSAKAQQPKPNGAAMNGAAKSGLDLDERGFGRY